MDSKVSGFLFFILGAAVGACASWQLLKNKYESIAQEEIDSMKKVYTYKKTSAPEEAQATATMAREKPNIADYASILKGQKYVDYSARVEPEAEEQPEEEEEKLVAHDISEQPSSPYVISPEAYDDEQYEDYDKISLSYYADGVLADENDNEIEDIEDSVGEKALTSFGEYEDDAVYVRNPRLRCDYEILIDQRNYSDVVIQNHHLED